MNRHYDVAIIGLGAMGSAAAAECAARGASVVGFEQFELGHARSSSHGESRIVRLAYFEHPDYVPLLRRARARWVRLNEEASEPVFHPSGGLWLGEPSHELIEGSQRAALEHDLEFELLDAHDVEARFPPVRVPSGCVGFYEAQAGVAQPECAVRQFIGRALALGAELRERTPVRSWHREEREFAIETDDALVRASRLIVAAGPWTARMLRDLGVPLVVTRQVSAWFREEVDPARFHPSRFPCWGLARDAHSFYYGFPILGDPPALKVSIHAPRAPTDPDHVDRTVQDEEIEELRDGLSKVMPEMREAPLAHASVCLYTNSPDGDFIIDLLENDPPLAVACGFSGHGFKFAPVVGEVLADLALDGGTCLPIGFLSRRRFGAAAG